MFEQYIYIYDKTSVEMYHQNDSQYVIDITGIKQLGQPRRTVSLGIPCCKRQVDICSADRHCALVFFRMEAVTMV